MMRIKILIVLMLALVSCSKAPDCELLEEKIELQDGSHIYVIHSHKCRIFYDRETGKPKWLKWSQHEAKIANFEKFKFSVYHYCIDSIHAEALNAVSRANIVDYEGFEDSIEPEEAESYYNRKNVLDKSDRTYNIYYSYSDTGLVKLPYDKQSVGNYTQLF